MSVTPLKRAIAAAGGASKLARKLGITHQAVMKWRRLPAERTLEVEAATGVSRHELRPDLYPPPGATPPRTPNTPSGAAERASEPAGAAA